MSSKTPGRVDLSMRQLSNLLKISATDVYRHEHFLAGKGTITLDKQGFTIANYSKYQGHKCYTRVTDNLSESVTPKEQSVTRAEQSVTPKEQSVTRAEQSVTNSVPIRPHKNIGKNIEEHGKNIEEVILLPVWLDKDTWNDFIEMRKKIKAPLTERGKKLLIERLGILRNSGNDPGQVINQSIMNSWKGLFPLKGSGDDGRPQTNRANNQGYQGNRTVLIQDGDELATRNARFIAEHGG
jgi:hypothetical protein